jgi:hypothetical protein
MIVEPTPERGLNRPRSRSYSLCKAAASQGPTKTRRWLRVEADAGSLFSRERTLLAVRRRESKKSPELKCLTSSDLNQLVQLW